MRAARVKGTLPDAHPGFTRDELAELFPYAAFRAAGFYALPARVQNLMARWMGRPLGRIKVGHVLIAYGQKPARRPH